MSDPFSPKFREAYDRIAPLGEGGMARVYRARQRELDRPVAIKVLRELSADQRARFEREARMLAQLVHAHILRVFDAGVDGDVPYLVCELVEGQSLDELARTRPLALTDALGATIAVAQALAHAHDLGVVHRDVKPANVLCPHDGPLKLADFGLARAVEGGQTLTAAGIVMGTPQYIAPEQVAGEPAGPASDQYALGAMLYELVTGRTPFAGDTALAQLQARLEGEPAPARTLNASLSPALETVLVRMLRRDPAARFARVDDAARALQALPEAPRSGEVTTLPRDGGGARTGGGSGSRGRGLHDGAGPARDADATRRGERSAGPTRAHGSAPDGGAGSPGWTRAGGGMVSRIAVLPASARAGLALGSVLCGLALATLLAGRARGPDPAASAATVAPPDAARPSPSSASGSASGSATDPAPILPERRPGSRSPSASSRAPERTPAYHLVLAYPELASGSPDKARVAALVQATGVPLTEPQHWPHWYALVPWLDGRRAGPPPVAAKALTELMDVFDEKGFYLRTAEAVRSEPRTFLARALRHVAAFPRDARTWYVLGWHLFSQGHGDAARRAYAHGLSLPPPCGNAQWPDWLVAAFARGCSLADPNPAIRILSRVEACPQMWINAWWAIRSELEKAAPELVERVLVAGANNPRMGDVASLELAAYRGRHGDVELSWRTIDEAVARLPRADQCVRSQLERHAQRGDRALIEQVLAKHPLPAMYHRLPALLWPGAAGQTPERMTYEELLDEPLPRRVYLSRLVEARSPQALAAVHDLRAKLDGEHDVHVRLLMSELDRQKGAEHEEFVVRASLAEQHTDWARWSELAWVLARSPQGRMASLMGTLEARRSDLAYPVARMLAASRRGEDATALAQLDVILRDPRLPELAPLLPIEVLLAPIWRAALKGAEDPVAQAARKRPEYAPQPGDPPHFRRLHQYVAEVRAGDFTAAGESARVMIRYQPWVYLWGMSIVWSAQLRGDHATRLEWVRRLQAAWRATACNLPMIRELERFAAPAR